MRIRLFCWISLALTTPMLAQSASVFASGASGSVAPFERLEAKHRSRLFRDAPSPGGQHYVFLDEASLRAGANLSSEIQAQPTTRGVTTVVHTFTSTRLSVDSDQAALGTVQLRNEGATRRNVDVDTSIYLQQPLRIHVRDRPANID